MWKWIFLCLIIIIVCGLLGFAYWWWSNNDDYVYQGKGLHPKVKKATDQLIQRSKEKKIFIRITQGYRSIERQNELYAIGRSKPGKIVTYAQGGESYHNYGLAIDFVIYQKENNQLSWDMKYDGNDNGKSDWMEVVAEAKKLGFAWGGEWIKLKDTPHFEMTFGQKIWELKLRRKLRAIYLDGKQELTR